ncbi:MAG: helix-turn-helix transcriptional regulator [Bacteroidota bacterium]
MVVTTVRHRLLEYLKKNRIASAREIARALDMTAPGVRHHLGILVGDGRVVVTATHSGGRGRPVKLYSLSTSLAGDNLAGMLDAALTEWQAGLTEEQCASALASLGARMGSLIAGDGPSLARRLSCVIEGLKGWHYEARWEAGAEGPRVIFGRCPYAAIIARHPELCQVDAAILAESLGVPVEQKNKLHPACIFIVTR